MRSRSASGHTAQPWCTVWLGASPSRVAPRNTASATSRASGPLTRSTASPATPGAVAIAAIVSSSGGMRLHDEAPGPRTGPALSRVKTGLVAFSRRLRLVGRSDRELFDQPVADGVGADPRILAQGDVNDPPLLRVQVLGEHFAAARHRVVGQGARQLLQLDLATVPEIVDLELHVIAHPLAAVHGEVEQVLERLADLPLAAGQEILALGHLGGHLHVVALGTRRDPCFESHRAQ